MYSKQKSFKEHNALKIQGKNFKKRESKKANFTSQFNPLFQFSFSVSGTAGSWWHSWKGRAGKARETHSCLWGKKKVQGYDLNLIISDFTGSKDIKSLNYTHTGSDPAVSTARRARKHREGSGSGWRPERSKVRDSLDLKVPISLQRV